MSCRTEGNNGNRSSNHCVIAILFLREVMYKIQFGSPGNCYGYFRVSYYKQVITSQLNPTYVTDICGIGLFFKFVFD